MPKVKSDVKAAKHRSEPPNLTRLAPWVLVVAGAIGLFASLMLSIEEFLYLQNPTQRLACDLNPLIGCGSILSTWQGHVLLGIPNQFFGIAAFSVVVTMGVLMLAGARFPRWIWQGLQAGVIGGTLFITWFFFQSLFTLSHLCPYCMITWVATLAVAWYTTLHNIQAEHIRLADSRRRIGKFAIAHHVDILVGTYVLLAAIILWRFWDFFSQSF